VTEGPAEVVVDLVEVAGVDDGGVEALVAGRDAARRTGVPLRVARAQPRVRHSLTAAGLLPRSA